MSPSNPLPPPPRQPESWIERVRAADGDAEKAIKQMFDLSLDDVRPIEEVQAAALIAIAAELRAQRIACRPGAGQT
jgi:hypothetical protein